MSDAESVRVPEGPPGAPATAKKSRGGLVVALVVVGVLLIAAVAGLSWFYYTRSPAYSLGMLASAAQNRDWVGVQKYVDVEAVLGNATDALIGQQLNVDTGPFGAVSAELVRSAKPALVQQAKDLLKQRVEQGVQEIVPNQRWLVSSFVVRQVKSVTYVGDEALVTVEVPLASGSSFALKLRMKRVDDHWRVVAIENILDIPGVLTK